MNCRYKILCSFHFNLKSIIQWAAVWISKKRIEQQQKKKIIINQFIMKSVWMNNQIWILTRTLLLESSIKAFDLVVVFFLRLECTHNQFSCCFVDMEIWCFATSPKIYKHLSHNQSLKWPANAMIKFKLAKDLSCIAVVVLLFLVWTT